MASDGQRKQTCIRGYRSLTTRMRLPEDRKKLRAYMAPADMVQTTYHSKVIHTGYILLFLFFLVCIHIPLTVPYNSQLKLFNLLYYCLIQQQTHRRDRKTPQTVILQNLCSHTSLKHVTRNDVTFRDYV
ncbi:hypothetical protein D918_08453 [Trichuris suis]|nr:hypothetical protein D918_08453 [Trichuris suis]